MLFNNTKNEIPFYKATQKSELFNDVQGNGKPIIPPTPYYLLDDSGVSLLDDSGEKFLAGKT